MDKKLIVAGTLWLSGFVTGVVVVARWWRMGENQSVTATPAPVMEDSSTVEEASSTLSVGKVQRTAQRWAGPLVAGAKADLLALRNATRHAGSRVASTAGVSDTAQVG
jgi:hypothetical protein